MATPENRVYKIVLGGNVTTDQLVQTWKAKGFLVDKKITQTNFPLFPRIYKETFEIELTQPEYTSFSGTEGLRHLKRIGLARPTYEHALRFVEKYAEGQRPENEGVIFLHEPWLTSRGGKRVLRVDCDILGRISVFLVPPNTRQGIFCTTAGVRQKK